MLTYQEILYGAQHLSKSEKARLLAEISATLQAELSEPTQKPLKSLLAIWDGETITSDEIDAARQDLWGDFPRKDI